jgi:hypothetical protein
MGFHASDAMVRMDRFKPSGKWYDTFAVNMTDYYDCGMLIHDCVEIAWQKSSGKELGEGWMLVCLEPYHKNAHPVMVRG